MSSILRRSAAAGLVVGVLLLTRRMTSTWGTRDDEHLDSLPGDELLPAADVVATRAVSIAARPEEVWPWLVQLGFGRGGFYSHDRLQNLAGLHITNASRVEARWQALAVGDDVHLAPEVVLRVVRLAPGGHLVLQGAAPGEKATMPFDFTWAFVLVGAEDGTTRLIVRERYQSLRWWARAVTEVVQPVSFVMTAQMLRGIRDRAESSATGG